MLSTQAEKPSESKSYNRRSDYFLKILNILKELSEEENKEEQVIDQLEKQLKAMLRINEIIYNASINPRPDLVKECNDILVFLTSSIQCIKLSGEPLDLDLSKRIKDFEKEIEIEFLRCKKEYSWGAFFWDIGSTAVSYAMYPLTGDSHNPFLMPLIKNKAGYSPNTLVKASLGLTGTVAAITITDKKILSNELDTVDTYKQGRALYKRVGQVNFEHNQSLLSDTSPAALNIHKYTKNLFYYLKKEEAFLFFNNFFSDAKDKSIKKEISKKDIARLVMSMTAFRLFGTADIPDNAISIMDELARFISSPPSIIESSKDLKENIKKSKNLSKELMTRNITKLVEDLKEYINEKSTGYDRTKKPNIFIQAAIEEIQSKHHIKETDSDKFEKIKEIISQKNEEEILSYFINSKIKSLSSILIANENLIATAWQVIKNISQNQELQDKIKRREIKLQDLITSTTKDSVTLTHSMFSHIPRSYTKDHKIQGIDITIPAKTTVFYDINFKNNYPFSLGKRSCPAEGFSNRFIQHLVDFLLDYCNVNVTFNKKNQMITLTPFDFEEIIEQEPTIRLSS